MSGTDGERASVGQTDEDNRTCLALKLLIIAQEKIVAVTSPADRERPLLMLELLKQRLSALEARMRDRGSQAAGDGGAF